MCKGGCIIIPFRLPDLTDIFMETDSTLARVNMLKNRHVFFTYWFSFQKCFFVFADQVEGVWRREDLHLQAEVPDQAR